MAFANIPNALDGGLIGLPVSSSTLQIYLLARDRPAFLREALVSVLNQIARNVEVIVSDNSVQDDVFLMLAADFPNVKYVRRYPPLCASEHFRTVLEEATAELLVMFHDDDVLLPGYIKTLRWVMDNDPTLVAVCPNAFIMRGSKATDEYFAPPGRGDLKLNRPEDMLREYFSLLQKGAMPFPGYMYRRSMIHGLHLEPEEGGKYADVSFLVKAILRGPIHWLSVPLMLYRMHLNNDSATEAVGQRLALLRFVYASTAITPRSRLVAQYRYRYWLSWWLARARSRNLEWQSWRQSVVRRFLLIHTVKYALTDRALWLYAWTKVKVLLLRVRYES